jgi:hypothetical protein
MADNSSAVSGGAGFPWDRRAGRNVLISHEEIRRPAVLLIHFDDERAECGSTGRRPWTPYSTLAFGFLKNQPLSLTDSWHAEAEQQQKAAGPESPFHASLLGKEVTSHQSPVTSRDVAEVTAAQRVEASF